MAKARGDSSTMDLFGEEGRKVTARARRRKAPPKIIARAKEPGRIPPVQPTTRPVEINPHWNPDDPRKRFDAHEVKASDLDARLAMAISAAIKRSGLDREAIAKRMSLLRGHPVRKPNIDQWSSVAKADRPIPYVRLVELAVVLEAPELLSIGAEKVGSMVISEKYLPLIRLASVEEQLRRLREMADGEREALKGEWGL